MPEIVNIGNGLDAYTARKVYKLSVRNLPAQLSCFGYEITADANLPCRRAHEIMRAVCRAYYISGADLTGPRRARQYARPRQVCMYLIRERCPHMSLPMIGRIMNRDHTTIMHGLERVQDLLETAPEFRKYMQRAVDQIASLG